MACEVHINQVLVNVSAETRVPLVAPSAQLQPKLWTNWSDYNNTSNAGVRASSSPVQPSILNSPQVLQVPSLAPPSNHVSGGVTVTTVQGVNVSDTATAPLVPELSLSNPNMTVAVPQLNGASRSVALQPLINNATFQIVNPTSFDTYVLRTRRWAAHCFVMLTAPVVQVHHGGSRSRDREPDEYHARGAQSQHRPRTCGHVLVW